MDNFLVQNHSLAVKVDREDLQPLILVKTQASSLESARKLARKLLLEAGMERSKFRFIKGGEGSNLCEHCFNGETMEPCWSLPFIYKGRRLADLRKLKLTVVNEW